MKKASAQAEALGKGTGEDNRVAEGTRRGRERIRVKIYSNQPEVALYQDGRLLEKRQAQKDQRVFVFEVSLSDGENHFEAVAGDCRDEAVFRKMANPRSYKLSKKKSSSANWV